MRYWILFLLALLLPLQAQAVTEQVVKESIVSQGEERTVYLFVPETVNASNPAPLIVLLHGSGRGGLSLITKWQDLASREGAILAAPDSADLSHWSVPEDGPAFLRDIVESLKARYPINPRRVYLFGHSAGAIFALYMSLIEPEYFAATAVHAGALPQNDTPLLDYGKRKIPIALITGTEDELIPLPTVRATHDALLAKGFRVELTEILGHDHWYYDIAPQINQKAWDFLKRYELEGEARYRPYSRWTMLKDRIWILVVVIIAIAALAGLIIRQYRARRGKEGF